MPCVITDLVCKFDHDNVPQPVQYASVYAAPAIVPVFVKVSNVFREVGAFLPRISATDVNGTFTFTLPWPSEQDPALTNWIITLPDDSKWMGVLPEGVAGPLTIHDLKELYGWGLITTTHEKWVPAAIQGPRGLPGSTDAATTTYSPGDTQQWPEGTPAFVAPALDKLAARHPIPSQASQSGKVLGTDGTNVQWVAQSGGTSLPSQTGNAGKVLGTDGTSPLWTVVSAVGNTIPSVGRWDWASGIGGVPGDFFEVTPTDGNPGWRQGVAAYANGFSDPRPDKVMNFGWNAGSQGATAGFGTLSMSFEDYYVPFGGSSGQMEFHFDWADKHGLNATRWLSFNGPNDGGASILGLHANTVEIGTGHALGDNVALLIADGQVQIRDTSGAYGIVMTSTSGRLFGGTHGDFTWQDGQLLLAAGTAAKPVLAFGEFPNTGIFFSETVDHLHFSVLGVDAASINSGGQIFAAGIFSPAHQGFGFQPGYDPGYGVFNFVNGRSLLPDADGQLDLGAVGLSQWRRLVSYWGAQPVKGSPLASASTITPTSALHHVTGAVAINVIDTSNLPPQFSGTLTLICDAATSFTNAGNIISPPFTATPNMAYVFLWDNSGNWYRQD